VRVLSTCSVAQDKDVMAEWRELLVSEEIVGLLNGFRDALFVRFSEIVAKAKADPPGLKGKQAEKGPAKGKGAAPKANAKENKKAAAEGAELDGPAAVVRDFENAKLLLDLKVT
jgi:hypothetical protein